MPKKKYNNIKIDKLFKDELHQYLIENFVQEENVFRYRGICERVIFDSYCDVCEDADLEPLTPLDEILSCEQAARDDSASLSLEQFIEEREDGFSDKLFHFIDKKGVSDVDCYKKANITKQVFSKIKKPNYKPTKQTALALAVALELSLEETKELLASAGLALSRSTTFDLIIEYCIIKRKYNIDFINQLLFDYDQTLLGTSVK